MEKRSRAIFDKIGGVDGADRARVGVASKGDLRWTRGAEGVNIGARGLEATATTKP